MSYLQHQIAASDQALKILRELGVCMIAGLPRTGKTACAIRVCEMSNACRALVVTKKAAIKGWKDEIFRIGDTTKEYVIVNYEQVKNVDSKYDIVIVDESHNVGRAGKPSLRWKNLKGKTSGRPVLLLTGTPAAESHLSYYYQFKLSDRTPLYYKNFYAFFKVWGVPCPVRVNGRMQETYRKGQAAIMEVLEPYIVKISQDDAGIKHKAEDKVHEIVLQDSTKAMIETIRRDKVIKVGAELVAFESDMSERAAVHQIECGAMLIEGGVVELSNNEVVEYLARTFKDTSSLGLMTHFRSTRQKLEKYFKHAKIFSSNAHSEGVDLSHLDDFVIVNSDYSGAKFIQRRERITNIRRNTAAVVHHIVTDGGISKHVYETLSDKRDFTLNLYRCVNNTYSQRSSNISSRAARG